MSEELAGYARYALHTWPLRDIEPENFDAYFVVGGHGTMWDLPGNAELQRILPAAHARGKVIAAVCHGPVALVQLKNPDGSYMIQGKKLNGFSNKENDSYESNERN
jgi:putative intracellular protease/amidase